MFKKKKNEEQEQNKNNKYADSNRQIAFFGFYLIFFIVVIILLRTGYKNQNNNKNNNSNLNGYGYDYKLTAITSDNYHFIYRENKNDVDTIYEGDILNNTMSITKSGEIATNYYFSKDKTYVKDNNLLTWTEVDNPITFKDFYDSSNIQSIINKANYVYRTEYMNESLLYFGYKISNNELRKIFKQEEVKDDDESNNIILITDKKGTVKSINFELTNYYKNIDPSINKYILSFNYSRFNEIKEITNPLN